MNITNHIKLLIYILAIYYFLGVFANILVTDVCVEQHHVTNKFCPNLFPHAGIYMNLNTSNNMCCLPESNICISADITEYTTIRGLYYGIGIVIIIANWIYWILDEQEGEHTTISALHVIISVLCSVLFLRVHDEIVLYFFRC